MGRRHPKLGIPVADLFCGAGGFSEGFAAAGFEIVYGVDNDQSALETFHANHPHTLYEQADLSELDKAALRVRLRDAEVIVGGPCCQGFSTGGRTREADWTDRNKLWSRMLLAVEVAKPSAFVLENVPGLVQHNDGKLSGKIVTAFESLGYRITSGILLAANYGLPQLRRRVFVVGLRGSRGTPFAWPEAPYLGGWRRDTLGHWEKRRIEQKKYRHLTVEDAIGDLPAIPTDSAGEAEREYDKRRKVSAYATVMRADSNSVRDHQVQILSDSVRRLISHVPPGGTWRDIPPHLRPGRFAGGMAPTDSTNLLGRLHPNRPAYTITTQFDNPTCGCYTHPTQHRGLSVREAARLQSFPDHYEFRGDGLRPKRKLVGNAVPPLLAQHLACEIAERISDKEPTRPKIILSSLDRGSPTYETRRRMRAQPRKATKPETLLAAALRRRGIAFSLNVHPVLSLRREVDIFIESVRLAVFVDGCFWHGCPIHTRDTKSNTKWWRKKINKNRARDLRTTANLVENGFQVLRIWEHEDPESAATKILENVAAAASLLDSRAPAATTQTSKSVSVEGPQHADEVVAASAAS